MGAFDFSYARPSAQEMVDAGGPNALAYTGAGKPRPTWDYLQSLLNGGVTFTFIQESYPSRSYEGYWAGVADAQYADAQADGVGYPDTAAIAYAASDRNRSDPGPGLAPSIREYGRGVADTSKRPLLAYGNRVAVDAFREGAGPKCVATWVPSSWDAQPGTDVLVQEANVTSPVPDTDWNTTYGEWPRWGAEAAPPPPVFTGVKTDMEAIVAPLLDGTSTLIVKGGGGQIYYDLTGPQWGGFLGMLPNHPDMPVAVNGSGGDRNAIPIREVGYDQIDAARKLYWLAMNPPVAGDPDKPISSFSDQELAAEANKRVTAGSLSITGAVITDS